MAERQIIADMAAAVSKLGLGIVLKTLKVAALGVLMSFCFVLRRLIRFLQRGDLSQARVVDFFGDEVRFFLRAAFGGDFARIHLVGGFK